MKKFKKIGAVALILVAVLAFSGIAQARNQGQIVYVEGVTRNEANEAINGEVDETTSNMKVQDIATGTTRTVVTNDNQNVMLNPAFTADGKKILFTANTSDDNLYEVFLVSSQAGTNLSSATPIRKDSTYNLRYATLSPNSDGATTGLLAYTRDLKQATGTHELWVYDFGTKKSSMIVQEASRQLKHPVFLADGKTIAYVGIKGGIQDIFTVDASSGLIINRTNNVSPTPRYGRLVSNVNKILTAADVLIYSKQTYGSLSYGKFDIFLRDLNTGIETAVTNTSTKDEYEPAFYGNSTTNPTLDDTAGDMFYSANITGSVSVWQTNFDTTQSTQSNGAKFERTDVASGLSNWGVPITIVSGEFSVALDETRIVFNNTNGDSDEISRADVNADGTATSPIQITVKSGPSSPKANPSLAGNGGTILYDADGEASIQKMNHDGSDSKILFNGAPLPLKQPNISSDGRWGVYVREGDLKAIYLADSTSTEKDLGLGLEDASNPSFNPEMTQIVYENDKSIYMVRVNIDLDTNTIIAGTPIRLTDSDQNVSDRYPSFSPDGKYIIFTSNRWDGVDAIYVMNSGRDAAVGSGVTRIVESTRLNATQTNQSAVFGPVNTDPAKYYVAYVNTAGEIQIATLTKQIGAAVGGEALVADLTNSTGLVPQGKFSWARERAKGSVYAERVIQSKAVTPSSIEYYIKVDVDEADVPTGYIISEVLPGWEMPHDPIQATDISIDGDNIDTTKVAFHEDTPASGQNNLKIVFSNQFTGSHKPKDHIIKIKVTTAGTSGDTQNLTGTVEYGSTIVDTAGNNTVVLGNPYCPFDIYNKEGNLRMDTDTGIIENLDLLFAIDCWAGDVQLQGHLGLWPKDISGTRYDDIIIETINIWATMPANGEAGEYKFLETLTVDEMYWGSGEWQD